MLKRLHFPPLTRQPIYAYYSARKEFFAASNYKLNYKMIAQDCKHRCVYCDATEKECGGEPFSLNHFRPQDVFATKFNGLLVKHPYNLYLSCQKCNVLKSKDWQGCTTTMTGCTYQNGKGYIDRFKHDVYQYMEVASNGRIYPKSNMSFIMDLQNT
ncbi:hypothetical protein ACVT98_02970 [Vibrio campbellii]